MKQVRCTLHYHDANITILEICQIHCSGAMTDKWLNTQKHVQWEQLNSDITIPLIKTKHLPISSYWEDECKWCGSKILSQHLTRWMWKTTKILSAKPVSELRTELRASQMQSLSANHSTDSYWRDTFIKFQDEMTSNSMMLIQIMKTDHFSSFIMSMECTGTQKNDWEWQMESPLHSHPTVSMELGHTKLLLLCI